MYGIDIESEAIEQYGPLLPEPVGVAIRHINDTNHTEYLSWGHDTNNNCTKQQAKERIAQLWGEDWVTHNGLGFDVPVLAHHFGLPDRDPLLTHDTLFMAYLANPHSPQLSLKWLAENVVGMPPTSQQELHDWIMLNVAACKTRRQCGAFIARAPGDLAGKYAGSDVDMTLALFKHYLPLIQDMMPAYNRERKLAPILADVRNRGVRTAHDELVAANTCYSALHRMSERKLKRMLKKRTINLNSGKEVATALLDLGYTNLGHTNKGAYSVAKDSLDIALAEAPELREAFHDYTTLEKLVTSFLNPWTDISTKYNGRLHSGYNQVRNPEGFGTRTGRLSSTNPNLQQVANSLGEGLPLMKSFLLPEQGHVWGCADFASQEPRITAHFEDGELLQHYLHDPAIDVYLPVAAAAGGITRKQAKQIFLGAIYSMGLATLATSLGVTAQEADNLRKRVRAAIPGVQKLNYQCKSRFEKGQHIKTLGGRIYHCEPPKNGRSWAYKALNTLAQGSAADQGKEALIYVHSELQPGERILGMVHDEISTSFPPEREDDFEQIFHEAANKLPCDCPMLMDFKTGNNWAEAK